MVRSVTTEQAATLLQGLANDLPAGRDVLVVEKDGVPVVAMISIDEYRRMAKFQEERDWAIIDQMRQRNRDMDPEEIERIVGEELNAYRRERRRAGEADRVGRSSTRTSSSAEPLRHRVRRSMPCGRGVGGDLSY